MIPEKFRQAHTKPPYGTDRLREAARVLRERAEGASVEAEPPWVMKGQWIESYNGTEIPTSLENTGNEADEVSVYIATMHPGVGLALADWLDESAHVVEFRGEGAPPTLTSLADLILGGEES